MAYEVKEKRGSLWKNEKKATDNHPDKTGSFKLNGKMYNIAVWEDQKSKDGSKTYDSVSVSEYKPKADSVSTTTPPVFDEEEVPF
tara:strand:- start:282 stop:536 length:255 start_codon:yes stop_codon:yes gene_type:complete